MPVINFKNCLYSTFSNFLYPRESKNVNIKNPGDHSYYIQGKEQVQQFPTPRVILSPHPLGRNSRILLLILVSWLLSFARDVHLSRARAVYKQGPCCQIYAPESQWAFHRKVRPISLALIGEEARLSSLAKVHQAHSISLYKLQVANATTREQRERDNKVRHRQYSKVSLFFI